MLNCREVAEMASDYIDKELPWPKSMLMDLHLLMCTHCSGFVDKLKLVVALVNKQPIESLSETEAENIVRMVVRQQNYPTSKDN